MNEINNNGMLKHRTSFADMSREPDSPSWFESNGTHLFISFLVGVAVSATVWADRATVDRDEARAQRDVCVAAAKVDHVRVGQFVDEGTYQFCYSDADVDVCVFRRPTNAP